MESIQYLSILRAILEVYDPQIERFIPRRNEPNWEGDPSEYEALPILYPPSSIHDHILKNAFRFNKYDHEESVKLNHLLHRAKVRGMWKELPDRYQDLWDHLKKNGAKHTNNPQILWNFHDEWREAYEDRANRLSGDHI